MAAVFYYGACGVNNLIQYFAPELTIRSATANRHLSNEAFLKEQGRTDRLRRLIRANVVVSAFNRPDSFAIKETSRSSENDENPLAALSAAELTQMRKDSWNNSLAREKSEGLQGFIQASVNVVIALIIFFLHWKIAVRQQTINDKIDA